MQTQKTNRDYSSPTIITIVLDNKISLQLESETPPLGPGESIGQLMPDNNPFKQQTLNSFL